MNDAKEEMICMHFFHTSLQMMLCNNLQESSFIIIQILVMKASLSTPLLPIHISAKSCKRRERNYRDYSYAQCITPSYPKQSLKEHHGSACKIYRSSLTLFNVIVFVKLFNHVVRFCYQINFLICLWF